MFQKMKLILKPIGNWTLFTVSVAVAFGLGYYYPVLQKSLKEEPQKFIQPKSLNQTSVSITDRGELIIIDRTSGKLDVYENKVGSAIFKAYGNVLTCNQPE
jgi:hypothetical protein